MVPVAFLGGGVFNETSTGTLNLTRLCRFQLVAPINSYCWQAGGAQHKLCTNATNEVRHIIAAAGAIKKRCPSALTQMYLNSMMNFWWYPEIAGRFAGANESLLLHDADGELVRVTQDGGNPNMTVFDWGQPATRAIFMETVDAALASGITSFFLDKASTTASPSGQICNHRCAQLTPEVARSWTAGHHDILRAVALKSSGPTVGNGGLCTIPFMGGGGASGYSAPASASGIEGLKAALAKPHTNSVFVHFPFTRDGYAAFLMGYTQGRGFLWAYTSGDPVWIDEFERSLGGPLGVAVLGKDGVYSRSFQHGTAQFDTRNNTGHFQWATRTLSSRIGSSSSSVSSDDIISTNRPVAPPPATRRVNWWFNALNTSFGAHEAAVARAHRSSVTGVYQWIQPNGFVVRNDGSVALPPPANIVAATAPLLELGLESGVCVPLAPGTLESGNAVKAVATLVAAAVTHNITTFIIDAEPSAGTPPSYCSAANANLYAEFLRALADGMHAHGKRAGMCIEMGCLLGPAYWALYASTGIDVMMSMGSTYYAHTPTSNVSTNEAWLLRELAVASTTQGMASKLAVGIGSVSLPQASSPLCWPPYVQAPWPSMYGWNASSLAGFMAFVEQHGFTDIDLYRADMAQCVADCVPQYYYDGLAAFLRGTEDGKGPTP